MKKIKLTSLVAFLSFVGFAQTNQQQLLNNSWYLTKIEVNNELILPPFQDGSENSILQFSQENEEVSFTQNQCVNSGFGNCSFIDETILYISIFSVTSSLCLNNDLDQFFNTLNSDVIWNNINTSFQYTITPENNLLQLQITGANGNKVFYETQPVADSKSFKEELLNIYPNPSSDFLNVSISDLDKIEIFDMLGKRIEAKYSSTENTTQIDIQQLVKGNYILQITKGTQTQNIKFIKE